jgi:hypothetical protein
MIDPKTISVPSIFETVYLFISYFICEAYLYLYFKVF